ncbi:lysozyme inhibitor LprI family protein [Ralstonia sp. UBA689]|uniref:lysozyme inhibitor LprI family protein n=1 Tax=Ralstonia sp. UBA689 TaxID=1947373 RepID=UPI0025EB0A8C|nr:lysozyme inhibitor LprI family protein [Ralstonia sp. UBA689]
MLNRYFAVIPMTFVLMAPTAQTAFAETSAEALYQQCDAKTTTAEQRDCYPAAVKQSEIELTHAEAKARAELVELEKLSEGSRSMHPVQAFDKAARAYRAFRDAESKRVMTSYGSGNGGGLAAYQTVIGMNLARAKQLSGESPT